MKDLTKYLDPSGLGVISFEDFHRGIRAIRNGGESVATVQVRPGGCQALRRNRSELGWCAGRRARGRLAALSNRVEKGGTGVVVVAVCSPAHQESPFLNVWWKQQSQGEKLPSGLVSALPYGSVGL